MPAKLEPPLSTPGRLHIVSPAGKVEVMPGYIGPRTEKDLPFPVPPRVWHPIIGGKTPPLPVFTQTQVDGRTYTVDLVWSGLRFLMNFDQLNVAAGESTQNLFTTHNGHTINNTAYWTEIGVVRFLQDGRYLLYTYSPPDLNEGVTWQYFGTTQPSAVYEFAIRLHENDPGPYRYETFCNGIRVRQGSLPRLDNQVDLSHETWSDTGVISKGDYVMALEGWVNYPPNKAGWYAPDLNIGYYSGNTSDKEVRLAQPFAFKFESFTP